MLHAVRASTDIAADLLKLMGSPALASRRWIYQQYDQSVGGDTVQRPGGPRQQHRQVDHAESRIERGPAERIGLVQRVLARLAQMAVERGADSLLEVRHVPADHASSATRATST